MTEDTELRLLIQVRDALTVDRPRWQLDSVESGRVGLVRARQIDDFVRAEATVELDNTCPPRFLVRATVIDCHNPVRLRTQRCSSTTDAARAAATMLRWVLGAAPAPQ